MNLLSVWMRAATTSEQELLASKAGTSRGHLYQLSSTKANRRASAALGARLEQASLDIAKASAGRLPKLYRTDLVEACHQCPYAQKCLGAEAVRADFPVVTDELLRSLERGVTADSEGSEL